MSGTVRTDELVAVWSQVAAARLGMEGGRAVSAQEAKRAEVAARIEKSMSISVAVTEADDIMVFHHKATEVGEYWDISYAVPLSPDGVAELAYQEDQAFRRLGLRFADMVVKEVLHERPNPAFAGSKRFIFMRACPKVVVK